MRTRLTIALLAATPFAATLAQATSASAPRAQTVNGAVVGVTLPSGVKAFRGVPFAAAPVRENRWRPPQPVRNWTGARLADRFADQCMQARMFGDMMFRNSGVSEDCLYLNVWMPATVPLTVCARGACASIAAKGVAASSAIVRRVLIGSLLVCGSWVS